MKSTERAFKGVWIPAEIWNSTELLWTEKCLIAEIDSLDNGVGCWASNDYLAEKMQTTKGNIANIISKLRGLGLIETVKSDGRNRWLKVRYSAQSDLTQTSPTGEPSIHPQVIVTSPTGDRNDSCYIDGEKTRGCGSGENPSVEGAVDGSPDKPKPLVRERNKLLDALVAVDGSDPMKSTSPAFKAAAVALKTIKEVSPDVTPEEISRRAKIYRMNNKDWSITPTAIAKYWGSCDRLGAAKPKRTGIPNL